MSRTVDFHIQKRSSEVGNASVQTNGVGQATLLWRLQQHGFTVDAHGPGPLVAGFSMDPSNGDPECVIMRWIREGEPGSAKPVCVDRRSTQVIPDPSGPAPWPEGVALAQVMDVVDRVQMALGHPVRVTLDVSKPSPSVVSVEELPFDSTFLPVEHRLLSLIRRDEGVVAPLSIDALDRALRREGASMDLDEATVRRVYGRPYRRDVMPQIIPDMRWAARHLAKRALHTSRDAMPSPLEAKGDRASLEAQLRRSVRRTGEVFRDLDLARIASRWCLGRAESVLGELDSHKRVALMRPIPTERRQSMETTLRDFALEVDPVQLEDGAVNLIPSHRARFNELRKLCEGTREISLDVRAAPWGESDSHFAQVLLRFRDGQPCGESVYPWDRWPTTQGGGHGIFAWSRLSSGWLHLLRRIVWVKGHLAESLCDRLLELRRVALAVGEHLEREGITECAEDALYLHVAELGQALANEPGAYAARVRLRREDDSRWGQTKVPRHIRPSAMSTPWQNPPSR